MATQSSFKQQCPSCEAMVPIRDPKLIGRKIDCPKCKYRFVVEEPVEEVEEAEEEAPAKGKSGATGITNKKPAGGKAAKPGLKRRPDDDEDEDEARPKKKQSGGSGMLIVGIALAAVAVVALAVGGVFLFSGGDKKDNKTSSGGPSANITPANAGQGGDVEKPKEPPKPEGPKPRHEDVTNLLPNDTQIVFNLPLEHLFGISKVKQALLRTPGAFHEAAFQRLWGVSPADVHRVVLAFNAEKKTVFSVMRTRTSVQLKEKQIVERLKLRPEAPIGGLKYYLVSQPLDALSTLLLKGSEHHEKVALHFVDPFTVVCADVGPMNQFLQEKGQPKHLSKSPEEEKPRGGGSQGGPGGMPMPGGGPPGARPGAPGGGPQPPGGAPQPPGGRRQPPSGGPQPSGGPPGAPGKGGQPPAPGGGQPPHGPGGPGGFQPPGGMPPGMMPPGMSPGGGASEATPVSSSYMTIDPQLKAVLDQAEKVDRSEGQNVLLSFASTLSAMTANNGNTASPATPDLTQIPLPVLKLLVKIRRSDPRSLGVGVIAFSESKFSANFAVATKDAKAAQALQTELEADIPAELLPSMGLDLVSKTAGSNTRPGMPGGVQGGPPGGGFPQPPGPAAPGGGGRPPNGFPQRGPGNFPPGMQPSGFPGMQPPEGEKKEEKGKDGDYQTWTKDNVVALGLNRNMTKSRYNEWGSQLEFHGIRLRGVAAISDHRSYIHELAAALQAYHEKEGHFPRGAVPRAPDTTRVIDWRPDQRLSWMTQLLPYLSNGEFKDMQFEFNKAWYEGSANQKAGFTLIPQFVTPLAPDNPLAFFVKYPNLPIKEGPGVWAATHFVGIAGVGLDAAEYRADDQSKAKLRGVFGYDRETKLDDIKDGADQTIAVIQVPLEPKSPWTAGGGSTVRGVSEDLDCVQPFVCTEYQGKRGTFAIMADGKVRFIPATINPKTFQAMCTINGDDKIKDIDAVAPEVPPPEDFQQPELKAEPNAPAAAEPPVKPKQPATKNELPPGWSEVASKQGRYTVAMPAGERSEEKINTRNISGAASTGYRYGITLPGNAGAYIVIYTDHPPGTMTETVFYSEKMLQSPPGSKIVYDKKFALDGNPCREFQIDEPSRRSLTTRMILVNNRLYQLTVLSHVGKNDVKAIQTFFDSFKLTGK